MTRYQVNGRVKQLKNSCYFTTSSFQLCVKFPVLVTDGVAACADGDDELGTLLVLGEVVELGALPVLEGEGDAVND